MSSLSELKKEICQQQSDSAHQTLSTSLHHLTDSPVGVIHSARTSISVIDKRSVPNSKPSRTPSDPLTKIRSALDKIRGTAKQEFLRNRQAVERLVSELSKLATFYNDGG